MTGSYYDPESTCKVKRWDLENQKYLKINRLTVMTEYSQSIGGVDRKM